MAQQHEKGHGSNMVRIWTSRYQNKTLAARDDLVKVGITLGKPKFLLGYSYVYLRLLAPSGGLFRVNDRERFTQGYRAQMEKLGGIDAILPVLQRISDEHGDRDLVLLCYEDVAKPGEWCHRLVLTDWLRDQLAKHPDAAASVAVMGEWDGTTSPNGTGGSMLESSADAGPSAVAVSLWECS